MIYISHRGNINGRILEKENEPSYIENALSKGYNVEVDVWLNNNNLFIGHDKPLYLINESFLIKDCIWCHAKNIKTLSYLLKIKAHCFFHNIDACTLTSKNIIWVYPGEQLVENSIAVLPEYVNYSKEELKICMGICTDNIYKYKKLFEN